MESWIFIISLFGSKIVNPFKEDLGWENIILREQQTSKNRTPTNNFNLPNACDGNTLSQPTTNEEFVISKKRSKARKKKKM